jgi:hypothetical protein
MFKTLSAVVVAIGLVCAGAPANAGDAPVTKTITQQGVVRTFTDRLPSCERGAPKYVITTTSNRVRHVTRFDDGRRHVTFTDTGRFSASPESDSSLPDYTGKFTAWGGFNVNGTSFVGTFTFSVTGTGSDGSTLSNHSVQHFQQLPSGIEKQVFRCH